MIFNHMKLRAFRGRSRRGTARFLKSGRQGLRALTESDFQKLLAKVPKGRNSAQGKTAKQIRRLMILLRNFDVRRERIAWPRRDSLVLDSLYPDRQKRWRSGEKREAQAAVSLSKFSFLDNPIGSLALIRDLAICEAQAKKFRVNFDDAACLDITPYMILGLIRDQMLPIISGGRIQPGIQSVLEAVGLSKMFKIKAKKNNDDVILLPFPLQQRRATGTSLADDQSSSVTTEEQVATHFAKTVDEWLSMCDPPQQLNPHGNARLTTIVGEVLDNAKRHSDQSTWDSSWAIAGFLEAREREDGSVTLACHIGIVNFGLSIFDSLQHAPEDVRQKVANYAAAHRSLFEKRAFDEKALWTACALQDGVSRIPVSSEGAPGGFGLMTLVEMMNALNQSSNPAGKPALTIISGSSCVMVRDDHVCFTEGAGGHRILAFNAANRLEEPPDQEYVFALPFRFPGTAVAMRFFLDDEMTTGKAA